MAVDFQAISAWLFDVFHPPIWKDRIQEDEPMWGFDGIGVCNPGNIEVAPDDANGANLSRVPDPSGKPGYALRHFALLDKQGAYVRSQAGVYGSNHKEFNDAAESPTGVYLEQECYIPEVLSANSDGYSWLSLQDIHVTDADGANRSWLALPVLQDGSMRAKLAWGGVLYNVNLNNGTPPPISAIPLSVRRPFIIKTHFIRSVEPTTIRVWFDNELALEWVGAINSIPSNRIVAYFVKLYGGVQHDNPWTPTPTIRYSRNVKIRKA